ncbi:ABC transporter ATP-binding protein [Streptomyces sp. NRRL S-87]|uniref:dipeptide ABC transporter ATP-binding protein n=1 Tax=Streptomyces sp. NRRL S-87 TaxID=1463920 RepID=UPI0004C0BB03|nr:ABC transporter ATP-binding protein [Streptomyces sp. NRRL S-87]
MTTHPVQPLVDVTDLSVEFPVGESGASVRAVDGLSFTLAPGRALGIVGESGSGKSTVAAALLGLHRDTGARLTGTVRVAGTDVTTAGPAELRRLRGGRAAMVFQDPLSSLDPYYAVGDQIAEVHRVHHDVSRRAARARAVEVLDRVGIPDAVRRSRARPHEFSGGMRQRALIAMALACDPDLLIADEPTTALDVTVQAQILDLLHGLREERGLALLLVTHDVGVAAESVDDLLVMKSGSAVERGPVATVLAAPTEAYTRALLAAVPRLEPTDGAGAAAPARAAAEARVPAPTPARPPAPVVEAVDLRREFGRGRRKTTAVDGVSLALAPGETLGIVGESGSGKSTLGRMLVGLLAPTAGEVRHDGTPTTGITAGAQMVFQDPGSSLNPRRSIGESIADPLRAAGERDEGAVRSRVAELLARVGLDPTHYDRYPHEFSGGQRQRVGIARALAPRPRLIVCDEPVSALDVTTQAQVTALLTELQQELGLALVFIAHDLAVVRQVSDRVAVMRQGLVVEDGPVDQVYGAPRHPYTRRLLSAVPSLDPALAAARRTDRSALTTV